MGIERFFNSIKKSYGNKIINRFDDKNFYSSKYLLFDFNSIIHNISQTVSSSLVYLYHINLISNIYPKVLETHKKYIDNHINYLRTDLIIESDIFLPDFSISDSKTNFSKLIDFNNLSLDIIDQTFFLTMMKNENLDKYIIHRVAKYILDLTAQFPNLKLIYMAIDGVPLYAKMLEQKKRRTIGYILELVKEKLLEYYKKDLNIDPNINNLNNEIYYNHYDFELKSKKLKFNKNKISPATQFMTDLENYLNFYLKNKIKFDFIVDSYNLFGEGEKKIVMKINELYNNKLLDKSDNIMVYSPDADVILLMLIEIEKCNINIMRFDQQSNQIDIIDIESLYKTIIEYMRLTDKDDTIKYKIIKDIVMLFTILGNDFLPKIEIINTNRHIENIFDAYLKIHTNEINLIFDNKINWNNLKQFFIILRKIIKPINNFKSNKEWKTQPDQIINSNAIDYYKHLFYLESLGNIYNPPKNKLENYNSKKITKKYLLGFLWLRDYYLDHNVEYKFFYYKYNIAPKLDQIIDNINHIYNLSRYKKDIYFNPTQQLIYISPTDITDIIDKNLLTLDIKKIIDRYNKKFNRDIDIEMINGKVNIFNYLDCFGAFYLSKCELKNGKKYYGYKILKKYL